MAAAVQHPLDATDRVSPEVVVVGAGPAGSVAALCLARSGASVLLLERGKLPRRKVCGGCVGPGALTLLERLDVAASLRQAGGEPFSVIELLCGSSRMRLRLGASTAITRATLDRLLVDAAEEAGARVQDGTRVSGLHVTTDEVVVTLRRGGGPEEHVRAAAVVDASGLGGLSVQEVAADARVGVGAVYAGADTAFVPPEGVLRMVVGRGGYVGMVRVEGGRLNVAAALDRSHLSAHGADGAVRRILGEAGCALAEEDAEIGWKGTPALTRRPTSTARPRVFRVGDAAGYVEPFTGEGIGWAVSSGILVAPFVLEAIAGRPEAAARGWRRDHRRLVAPRQRVCRFLSAGLRRPRFVGAALALLSVAPRLADPLVRLTRRAPKPALDAAGSVGG